MERSASAPSLLSAGDARVSDGAAGVSGFDVARLKVPRSELFNFVGSEPQRGHLCLRHVES